VADDILSKPLSDLNTTIINANKRLLAEVVVNTNPKHGQEHEKGSVNDNRDKAAL
jgi:hypothetical protein